MGKNHKGTLNMYGDSLYIPGDVVEKWITNSFLKNLVVYKIGYFIKANGHFIRRDGIDEYIMLYCVEGKGWVESGGRVWEVCKGDLAICSKNCPHAYGADKFDPWTIHWAHFFGEGVPDLFSVLGVSEKAPLVHVGISQELVSLMNEVSKTLETGYSFPNLFYATTCFQEFFCHCVKKKMYSPLNNSANVDVEDVISHMVKNVFTVFSLKQLADYAKMSKYHFARRFKEKTGYSPIDYFNRLKIQKACEMLETSILEINEISDRLSFNNPFYFSEVFKKIIGSSPRKYRKMNSGAGKFIEGN